MWRPWCSLSPMKKCPWRPFWQGPRDILKRTFVLLPPRGFFREYSCRRSHNITHYLPQVEGVLYRGSERISQGYLFSTREILRLTALPARKILRRSIYWSQNSAFRNYMTSRPFIIPVVRNSLQRAPGNPEL